MAAVAEQAGVTRVLLYRHFDSKDALYRAVLDEVLTSLKRSWDGATSSDSAGAAVRSHLAVARSNPNGYRLLWHHAETEPAFADYAHEVRRLLADVADERVGRAIAPPLRDWAMTTLVATIVEATLAWLDHGHPAHDEEFVRAATAGMVRQVEGWSEVESR